MRDLYARFVLWLIRPALGLHVREQATAQRDFVKHFRWRVSADQQAEDRP